MKEIKSVNFLQSYNAYRKDKRKASFLRCDAAKRKADLPSYKSRPSLLDTSCIVFKQQLIRKHDKRCDNTYLTVV